MYDIIERMQHRATGMVAVDTMQPMPLASAELISEPTLNIDNRMYEFKMEINVGCLFRVREIASNVEVEAKKFEARKLLAMEIFAEFRKDLYLLRASIDGGDRDGAFQILERIMRGTGE